ncbi:MAG: hypothetical protein KAY22_21325 [Rhizorhabdus sp.]|uniref:hypothetical protein n=1 Tax=Rhizorhabdus sp. TaxID=1968843 RepID=UPI001B6C5F7A|nr:hypothetical protein [Rhizorhabdus sp.]MBP8234839.1 hypothetical protein [Rhizorhabdus sp.]
MVTSRQFARGMVRTMRAMDRAAKQAERQRIARQNALHREAMLDAAAQAVAEYEEMVEALTGGHRITFGKRDWLTTATAPDEPHPARRDDEELAARARLDGYVPGFLDRMLRRGEKVMARLADDVDAARRRDDDLHARAAESVASRNAQAAVARKVVERDPDALVAALEQHSDLGRLPFSVEGIDTIFLDRRVIAVVDGLDLEDMPDESVTLLKSGKASFKALAAGKRLEMHRDAICSAALRVAIEFLSTLPLDEVEVLMLTDILDPATGHIAGLPVLYVRVAEQALRAVNLGRTDACALVERLGGHISWSRRDGFRAINAAAFGIDLCS